MKIIFSDNKESFVASDARRLIRIEEAKRTLPLVASAHKAVSPRQCEHCDSTFWVPLDTWAAYCSKGCADEEERKVGF